MRIDRTSLSQGGKRTSAGNLLFPGWADTLLGKLQVCLLDTKQALLILLGLVAVIAGEWLGRTFKMVKWLRSPMSLVTSLFTRFLLPALGAFPVYAYLKTIGHYFVEQGKVS